MAVTLSAICSSRSFLGNVSSNNSFIAFSTTEASASNFLIHLLTRSGVGVSISSCCISQSSSTLSPRNTNLFTDRLTQHYSNSISKIRTFLVCVLRMNQKEQLGGLLLKIYDISTY